MQENHNLGLDIEASKDPVVINSSKLKKDDKEANKRNIKRHEHHRLEEKMKDLEESKGDSNRYFRIIRETGTNYCRTFPKFIGAK